MRIFGGGYDLYYENASPLMKFIIRKIMGRAEAIIVQTELVRTKMVDIWPSNVFSIPNYRPLVAYDPKKRDFKKDSTVFIYAGTIHKLKGCEELLNAFLELNQLLVDNRKTMQTRLDLFGQHVSLKKYSLDLSKYKQYSNIVFHGLVSNDKLMQKYVESDVFVFPTYWPTEGHSGAVIEALMHGLPVITTNWRAMTEVVQHGVNGLLCELQDVSSLTQAMYRMCTDLSERRRLSEGARSSAMRFNHQSVCAQLIDLVELDATTPAVTSTEQQ
ncbi:MAG: glycosyltransferase family 4 protein [Chloroflexi bacterium]|nr:glycosyltransferase family 4 protein [Chloroflexota bacterium]